MRENPNRQRRHDLEEHINNTWKLIKQYEDEFRLSDDPKKKRKFEKEIADLRNLLKDYQDELNNINSWESNKQVEKQVQPNKHTKEGIVHSKQDEVKAINSPSKTSQVQNYEDKPYPVKTKDSSTSLKQIEYREDFFQEVGRCLIRRFDYTSQEPLVISHQWLARSFEDFKTSHDFISKLTGSSARKIDYELESLLDTSAKFIVLSKLTSTLLDIFEMVSFALSIPIERVYPNNQLRRLMELATSVSEQFRSIADSVSWGQTTHSIVLQIELNLTLMEKLTIDILEWLEGMVSHLERLQD